MTKHSCRNIGGPTQPSQKIMLPEAEAVVPCITESNSLFKRSVFGDNKDKIQFVQKLYKRVSVYNCRPLGLIYTLLRRFSSVVL